jgi:hypothetical protein
MNVTETECPICDRKVQSDMAKCPNCGADLSLSSFADLEEVAIQLSTDAPVPPKAKVDSKEQSPRSEPRTEEIKPEAPPPEKKEGSQMPAEPKKEEKATVEPNKDESKHGLGRLFGKKKK